MLASFIVPHTDASNRVGKQNSARLELEIRVCANQAFQSKVFSSARCWLDVTGCFSLDCWPLSSRHAHLENQPWELTRQNLSERVSRSAPRCRADWLQAVGYTDTTVPAWVRCTRSVPRIKESQDQSSPPDLPQYVRIIGCSGILAHLDLDASARRVLFRHGVSGPSVKLLAIPSSIS